MIFECHQIDFQLLRMVYFIALGAEYSFRSQKMDDAPVLARSMDLKMEYLQ